MTNPFTGEKIPVHNDPGLSETELAAVRNLLRQLGAQSVDIGEYHLKFSDNDSLSVQIGPLDGSSAITGAEIDIACKQLRDDHLDFVWQFASAANMALVTNVDTGSGKFAQSTRVLSEKTRRTVEKRWPEAKVLENKEQLRQWLDQVVESRLVY